MARPLPGAVDQLIAHIDCLREVPEIHLLHVHLPIPIGRVQACRQGNPAAYYLEEGSSNCRQRRNSCAGRSTPPIFMSPPAEVIGKMAAELDCDLIHGDAWPWSSGWAGHGLGGDARVGISQAARCCLSNERG